MKSGWPRTTSPGSPWASRIFVALTAGAVVLQACSFDRSGIGPGRTDGQAPVTCGNGALDTGEPCDGTDLGGMDCVGLGYDGGELRCTGGCTYDVESCVRAVDCGNGTVDPGEECDDGNTDNTDACLTNCRAAACGDGFIRDGVEECDSDPPRACTTWCGSTGSQPCSDTCTWEECRTVQETCNGEDDDCDGLIDNGFECPAGATDSCTASCDTTGSRTCSAACQWQPCEPPGETCNGTDDDCDGLIDDGFECPAGSTGSCTTGCGSTGSRTCSSTCEWNECQTPAESCNGMDDDCDGTTDNECPAGLVFMGSAESDLFGSSTGGTAFDDTCPAGQVLVSLSGKYAGNIDRVRGHCGIVSLLENQSVVPYTYSVRISSGTLLPSHGNNNTGDYSIQCPAHTMAVGLAGVAVSAVSALELMCAPLQVSGSPGSFVLSRGTVTSVSVTGSNPGNAFSWTAPGVYVLNRLFGRSGAWIDAIGVGATEPRLLFLQQRLDFTPARL